MPTYLLACDRQNSPIDGVGFPGRSYTAYGARPSPIGPMTGFCGQPRDARMDRYPLGNGHRRYSPVLMRFHEPDALSPFGEGGINAYAYCGADPVNRNDPTGKVSFSVALAIPATHQMLALTLLWRNWPQGDALAGLASVFSQAGFSLLLTAGVMKTTGDPRAVLVGLLGTTILAASSTTKHINLSLKNRRRGETGAQPQDMERGASPRNIQREQNPLLEVRSEEPPSKPSVTIDMSDGTNSIREGEEIV